MSLTTLRHLIAEARSLANDGPCAAGHYWESEGARGCPQHLTDSCGQTVYRCVVCGELDYGYRGGPGHRDCQQFCRHRGESRTS